jgi:hypothetical protein
MKGTILLNYDENTHKVEEEEKQSFIRATLEEMGLPVDEFWTVSGPLSVEQKIKLRTILTGYGAQVIDSLDGEVQIYVDKEKIAAWEKPTYKLCRDLREIDPRKQLYLEMHINYWTVFESIK